MLVMFTPNIGEDGAILTSIHPGRLTWNLQITHLERKMIFQTSMIMFHVNLQGCMSESRWCKTTKQPTYWMVFVTPILQLLLVPKAALMACGRVLQWIKAGGFFWKKWVNWWFCGFLFAESHKQKCGKLLDDLLVCYVRCCLSVFMRDWVRWFI